MFKRQNDLSFILDNFFKGSTCSIIKKISIKWLKLWRHENILDEVPACKSPRQNSQAYLLQSPKKDVAPGKDIAPGTIGKK